MNKQYGRCLWMCLLVAHGSYAIELFPFQGEPPTTEALIADFTNKGLFTKEHREKRKSGETITIANSREDEGMAIFRVKASERKVWQTISNFDDYPMMIPELRKADRYQTDRYMPNERQLIYIRFQLHKKIAFIPITKNYSVIHDFPSHFLGWGTWWTDETQDNDFENSGFWRVMALSPKEVEVTYYAKIKLHGIDKWVKGYVMDEGLSQATKWVREYAEK